MIPLQVDASLQYLKVVNVLTKVAMTCVKMLNWLCEAKDELHVDVLIQHY